MADNKNDALDSLIRMLLENPTINPTQILLDLSAGSYDEKKPSKPGGATIENADKAGSEISAQRDREVKLIKDALEGAFVPDKNRKYSGAPLNKDAAINLLKTLTGTSTPPGQAMSDTAREGGRGSAAQPMGMGEVQQAGSANYLPNDYSARPPQVPGGYDARSLIAQLLAEPLQGTPSATSQGPRQRGESDTISKGPGGVFTNTPAVDENGAPLAPAPDYLDQQALANRSVPAVGIGGLPMDETTMQRNELENRGYTPGETNQGLIANAQSTQANQKYPTQLAVADINARRGDRSDAAKIDRTIVQQQLMTQRATAVQAAQAALQNELQASRSESAKGISLQKMQEAFGLAKAKAKSDFQDQLITEATGEKRLKTKDELLQGFNEIDQQFDAAAHDAFGRASDALGVNTSRLELYSKLSSSDRKFLEVYARHREAVFSDPAFTSQSPEEQARLKSLVGLVNAQ